MLLLHFLTQLLCLPFFLRWTPSDNHDEINIDDHCHHKLAHVLLLYIKFYSNVFIYIYHLFYLHINNIIDIPILHMENWGSGSLSELPQHPSPVNERVRIQTQVRLTQQLMLLTTDLHSFPLPSFSVSSF